MIYFYKCLGFLFMETIASSLYIKTDIYDIETALFIQRHLIIFVYFTFIKLKVDQQRPLSKYNALRMGSWTRGGCFFCYCMH